jgi:hypothetical protein
MKLIFLIITCAMFVHHCSAINGTVITFWFGKSMTGLRLNAFHNLQQNIGVPVTLITEDDIYRYNLTSDPIHPGWKYLSGIHKGDYLRVYFMHHYGGGYHDIKFHNNIPWTTFFEAADNDSSIWVTGIREHSSGGIACDEGHRRYPETWTCDQVKSNWENLVSNGAYIIKRNTTLTQQWMKRANDVLDSKLELLKLHPPPWSRCCLAPFTPESVAYPIRWAELHGEIFHPLQHIYSDHIRYNLPRWTSESYSDPSENVRV